MLEDAELTVGMEVGGVCFGEGEMRGKVFVD